MACSMCARERPSTHAAHPHTCESIHTRRWQVVRDNPGTVQMQSDWMLMLLPKAKRLNATKHRHGQTRERP